MKPSSSPPRARRSARPIAAPSTTPRPRRSAAMRSPTRLKRASVERRRGRRRRHGRGAAAGLAGRQRRPPVRCCAPACRPASPACRSTGNAPPGLMAIAIAAKEIVDDGMSITVGGGLESISLVQNDKMNRYRAAGPVARRASRRRLHDDARDGRDRRRALQDHPRAAGRIRAAVAAAHRRGAGRRPVRRRDRRRCRA